MAKSANKHDQVAHYYPGETIFREGQSDDSIYVIKTGDVDISIIRNGKNIILQRLKPGECFGEMAALLHQERSATATAASYTEVYKFTQTQLAQLMEHVPPVIRQLLMSQLRRLIQANNRVVAAGTPAHPLVIAAELIELHARSTKAETWDNSIYYLPYHVVTGTISKVMGLTDYGIGLLLQKMQQLDLLTVTEKKESKRIELKSRDIVERATRLSEEISYDITGQCPTEPELFDLETLVNFTGGVRKNILSKLSTGDFPEKSFMFRRSEIIKLLNEHGKDFFVKRKAKSAEEWNDIEDLEYCDTRTLEKAIGRLETYQLGVLMQGVPSKEIQQRIEQCLSERRKETLREFAEDIGALTDTDIELVTDELFDKIRMIKAS